MPAICDAPVRRDCRDIFRPDTAGPWYGPAEPTRSRPGGCAAGVRVEAAPGCRGAGQAREGETNRLCKRMEANGLGRRGEGEGGGGGGAGP